MASQRIQKIAKVIADNITSPGEEVNFSNHEAMVKQISRLLKVKCNAILKKKLQKMWIDEETLLKKSVTELLMARGHQQNDSEESDKEEKDESTEDEETQNSNKKNESISSKDSKWSYSSHKKHIKTSTKVDSDGRDDTNSSNVELSENSQDDDQIEASADIYKRERVIHLTKLVKSIKRKIGELETELNQLEKRMRIQ